MCSECTVLAAENARLAQQNAQLVRENQLLRRRLWAIGEFAGRARDAA